jgi:hypothetical protein
MPAQECYDALADGDTVAGIILNQDGWHPCVAKTEARRTFLGIWSRYITIGVDVSPGQDVCLYLSTRPGNKKFPCCVCCVVVRTDTECVCKGCNKGALPIR